MFPFPSRAAVYAEPGPFEDSELRFAAFRRAGVVAQETSDPPRKITIQAFGILPKVRQIDEILCADENLPLRIIESHPEAAFCVLNGGSEMQHGKKTLAGAAERRAMLLRCGFPKEFVNSPPPKGSKTDDFLDACVMLLVAERKRDGIAVPHPSPLVHDACGLPIAIWT